ncbi:MAG: diguanylate cyclase [Ketobacter sp.]|nr:MAG: diguanylate cyclase [Ketobacter sp.]
MRVYIFVATLICLLSNSLVHSRVVVSDAPNQSLNASMHYYEDTSAALNLNQLRQRDVHWQPNGDREFSKGYSNSHWWLKLELQNTAAEKRQRYIEISYALLDSVSMYVVESETLISELHLGDKHPFHTRPVNSPHFVFPIEWQPNQTLTVYFEVHSAGSLQVPMMMWQQEDFYLHQMHLDTVQGIYWGGILIIFIYNGLLFFALRDSAYFWYVGSVLFIALAFTSHSGQAYRYLWPEFTHWNNISLLVMICLSCIFAGQFVKIFLNVKRLSPLMERVLNGLITLFIGLAGLSWWGPYHVLIQVSLIMVFALVSCAFLIGVFGVRKGDRSARWYLLSWTVFLAGVVIISLSKFGLLPTNFFTQNSAQIGSMLEAALLSFALADRINREKLMRLTAQQALLYTTEKMKEELEVRVQERTRDLEALNDKLEQLSQTDQLTGLKNRRYLGQRIEEEFNRCARYNHAISVLMIDVDHFKSVNDRYGHAAGDQCLKTIASHLLTGVRLPPDVAARLGGEEFCLLLPETSSAGALTVAERIRASIHGSVISSDNIIFSVSVSIGVFTQSSGDYEWEQALRKADEALYQAKNQGRNRVVKYAAGA